MGGLELDQQPRVTLHMRSALLERPPIENLSDIPEVFLVGRDDPPPGLLRLSGENDISVQFFLRSSGLPADSCLSPELGRQTHGFGGDWNVVG